MKRKFLLIPLVAATLVSPLLASVTQAAGPARPHVVVKKIGPVLRTETVSADGLTTVSTTGPKALATSLVEADDKTAEADTNLPSFKSKTGGPLLSDADSAAAPTVYEDLIAGGATPEEACDFVADFDSRGCQTAAQVALHTGVIINAARAPYDSWCVNIRSTKGDGVKTSHACVIRYRDYAVNGNWYMANTMKQTARSKDPGTFFDRLNDIRVQMRYSAGNSTVDWAPIGTRTVGSCQSTTTSVTSPKTGASYSSSNEVCPDRIAPYANTDFRWFGSKWSTSHAREGYVGNVASSVVHSPPSASATATLHSYIHWN